MKRILLATALALASAAAFAAPVTYQMDPNHTNVIASWSHFGFSNPFADFGQAKGEIVYDADDLAKSSVQVALPLAGLNAFSDKFNEHLKSADFFDAEKYPEITFKSTKVESEGEGKLKVTGDLTVKGVTKPTVLNVSLNKAGDHPMAKRAAIGFDAETVLKRSDFGVDKYAPNVGDEVTIKITTEALVAKADAASK